MSDLVTEINRKQVEIGVKLVGSLGSEGRPTVSPAMAYVLGLSPEKLAVITIRTVLGTPSAADSGTWRLAIGVARKIGARVVAELEYERWRRQKTEEAKEKDDGWNAAHWLSAVARKVDYEAWQRWKRRRTDIEDFNVSLKDRIRIGDVLLWCAGQTEWFSLDNKTIKAPRRRKVIFLTQRTIEAINAADDKLSLQRPYYLPMVCEPKPWRRK